MFDFVRVSVHAHAYTHARICTRTRARKYRGGLERAKDSFGIAVLKHSFLFRSMSDLKEK